MGSDIEARLSEAFEQRRQDAGVVSAYLFGSHAANRAHRASDIDVGVLLDRSVHATRRARFDARLRLIADLGAALGTTAVDLVVLNDAPPHLARHVMSEGRRLFCADPETDHAAMRTALSRAADLEPFLRRTRRVKLDRLAR
jgi:predicted nucleotidyltransferase